MLFKLSFILSTLARTCSPWPESQKFGCTSGGDWKELDASMSLSDLESCEELCVMEHGFGCCYLKNGLGCYWKPRGYSVSLPTSTGISVTCESAGINRYIVSIDGHFYFFNGS